jgi:hypothetical protein
MGTYGGIDVQKALGVEEAREVQEWIRGRPDTLQPLLLKLPPGCIVRATRSYWCPAPGRYGTVICYNEHESGSHTVLVADCEQMENAGECDPAYLEVVEYAFGVTPDFVRQALKKG